ncbi:unnamed protein product, partial [Lepidochelys olivacea]
VGNGEGDPGVRDSLPSASLQLFPQCNPLCPQVQEGGPWGPEACPSLGGVEGSPLVPVGVTVPLSLAAHNLQLLGDPLPALHCVVEVGGAPVSVEASLDEEGGAQRVRCRPHVYSYSLPPPELPAPLYVTVGGTGRLDNRGDLHVTLYNCSVGRADCSHCLAAPPELGCVWCPAGGGPGCRYRDLCPPGTAEPLCPTPIIQA